MFDSSIELGIVIFLFIYSIVISLLVVKFQARKK
jgi:hypothetical protein